MKKLIVIIGSILTMGVVGVLATVNDAATYPTISVYRLYNRNTGEHFYTASSSEKAILVRAGWSDEGIGWKGAKSGSPVYRVYNPNAKGGDHYYTKSKSEAAALVRTGWKWDNAGKAVFYSSGNIKLYVAYNPNAKSGAHNYTTNHFEQSTLLKDGWKYGTIAWSVKGLGKTITPAAAVSTGTSTSGPSNQKTVYIAGKDSSVYWYSRSALIAYGKKVHHPVNQSEIFTMGEQDAIRSGRHHSAKE